MMCVSKMQHIPLDQAYLCPNCNSIGNDSTRCPACANPHVLALAAILDRQESMEHPTAEKLAEFGLPLGHI